MEKVLRIIGRSAYLFFGGAIFTAGFMCTLEAYVNICNRLNQKEESENLEGDEN